MRVRQNRTLISEGSHRDGIQELQLLFPMNPQREWTIESGKLGD